MSMAMTTYLSSTYKGNEDGGSHRLRDASFSSYLDSTVSDFVRNLVASVHSQPSLARASSVTPRACLGRTRLTRPELGVFGAERYFNEKLDDQTCPIPRRNGGVKSKNNRYRREKTMSPSPNNHLEDQPRKSLEIFGFRPIGKQDIAQSLERKGSILTWDAIPNSQKGPFTCPYPLPLPLPLPFPSTRKTNTQSVRVDHHEQDARSEASSDLFEIEHLSGIIPGSQSSYATSEASVEWSVVTASAAEFSVVSEYRVDEKMDKKMANMEKIKGRKNSSTLGGGLWGVRNHKRVDVGRSINTNANNKKKLKRTIMFRRKLGLLSSHLGGHMINRTNNISLRR